MTRFWRSYKNLNLSYSVLDCLKECNYCTEVSDNILMGWAIIMVVAWFLTAPVSFFVAYSNTECAEAKVGNGSNIRTILIAFTQLYISFF